MEQELCISFVIQITCTIHPQLICSQACKTRRSPVSRRKRRYATVDSAGHLKAKGTECAQEFHGNLIINSSIQKLVTCFISGRTLTIGMHLIAMGLLRQPAPPAHRGFRIITSSCLQGSAFQAPHTSCMTTRLRVLPVSKLEKIPRYATASALSTQTRPTAATAKATPSDYRPWSPPTRGVLSLLPTKWVSYAELMRIEKTGDLYGFYLPYLIGHRFAASMAPTAPSPWFVLSTSVIFLAWTVLLRGSVCTINDNLDRDFDRQVARCRTRPIARGAISPTARYV